MKGIEGMSESRAVVTNGWSTLDTVDDLDIGVNNDMEGIVKARDNASKAIVKSLFIESLIDQLCKLLEKDPIKRHKLYEGICSKLYEMQLIEETYHVEELASLRGYYQQALINVMVTPDTRLCSGPCITLGSSRYATEYEEISFIASGGFGNVFKARNRLDQVVYAVKKITLKYQSVETFARKINEVKTLAKLNHPNIVQYRAAWLEPFSDLRQPLPATDVTNLSSNDSDIVVFKSNSSNSGSNKCLTEEDNENDKNLAVCKYNENNVVQRPGPQVCALLYVSMQLCDKTLYDWLLKRNFDNAPIDIPLVLSIMMQTATGVQYIHSCDIVHHDIKPRNIFLSSDLKSVQVGDFGLSCRIQGHDHSRCPLEGGQFGTPLYAAPEQLNGCCDPKSDIFSLGLVFIELLTIFSTEMERAKILTKVRSGYLPPSIPLVLVPTIKSLLSHNPNKRPTATEFIAILKQLKLSDFVPKIKLTESDDSVPDSISEESQECSDLERDELIKDKEREIAELRQMLAEKENEIAELRHLINKTSL